MGQAGLKKLEAALGHSFRREALLVQALTHSSLACEQGLVSSEEITAADTSDNEQLEFLGDAVVGLLVADSLYQRYPALREGELTRLRAALVSRRHLGRVAATLNLGEYMFLGKGEERSGGRRKAALLANCIEAVIGALYLDAGLDTARIFVEDEVVKPYVAELYEELTSGSSIGDHKSALQEFLQARKAGKPEYVVKAETGPDHRKKFLVEVHLSGTNFQAKVIARGTGTTKKEAEQEAARRAYQKLLGQNQPGEARA